MFIIEGIEHLAAIAAGFHQVRRSQNAQLVAHHRLLQIQALCDIVHRKLPRQKDLDNADSRRISKKLEKLRQLKKSIQRNFVFAILNI